MATSQLISGPDRRFRLWVDGAPYFIKGAGLEFGQMALLAACGGNTFRTWRVNNGAQSAEEILDEAARLGLKVCMGLDLARERHGFDYSDALSVAQQQEAIVRHPDKQIIITEAGWATASDGRGIPPENVSEHCQQQYVRDLLGWARDREILVYLFEAFDENWKGSNHPLEPEKHWGIYRADRQPKLVISP